MSSVSNIDYIFFSSGRKTFFSNLHTHTHTHLLLRNILGSIKEPKLYNSQSQDYIWGSFQLHNMFIPKFMEHAAPIVIHSPVVERITAASLPLLITTLLSLFNLLTSLSFWRAKTRMNFPYPCLFSHYLYTQYARCHADILFCQFVFSPWD